MSGQIISVDWGTSKLSVSVFDTLECLFLAEKSSTLGIGKLHSDGVLTIEMEETARHEVLIPILEKEIDALGLEMQKDLKGLPVYISGMASSNLGLLELPYRRLPAELNHDAVICETLLLSNYEATIISGMASDQDVMRGEETQVLGVCSMNNEIPFILLPGTHSKHVEIADGKVKSVKTFMTGELFEALSGNTILSKSIKACDVNQYLDSFLKGVGDIQNGALLNQIFTVRTNQLLHQFDKEINYAYLSGLMIGEELKSLPEIKSMALICSSSLKVLYESAIRLLKKEVQLVWYESEFATAMGHRFLYLNK